jgi:hypothetical protein
VKHLTKILLAGILIFATPQIGAGQQEQKPLLRQQTAPVELNNQQQIQQQRSEPEMGDPAYISRAMFTTRISDAEPVSDLYEIETDFSQVFFFTELMQCDDCEFTHEWYYNGQKQFETEAYSEWPHYKYWSSVNLKPSFTGTWTVRMVVEGELFAEKSFIYYQPSEEQQQTRGIQQRIEKKSLTECEENLRYFSDQARSDPDEPYFQFMLEKWGKRCLE